MVVFLDADLFIVDFRDERSSIYEQKNKTTVTGSDVEIVGHSAISADTRWKIILNQKKIK